MHAHTPIQTHSQKHLTHWFWLTVCKALPCADKQKISSDRYFSCCLTLGQRWPFISKSVLTLPAYVGVSMPLWSSSLNTEHSCKVSRVHQCVRHFPCEAVQCILGRDENYTLGDLSSQVMKYTFFREGHTAGPDEWGICNDKTMIYSGWSSRGRVRNTLTMIYYLLSAKMELCCSQRKKKVCFFSLFLIGMIHCYQIDRHSSNFQMFSH